MIACVDPISKEDLEEPYLASDGETYSLQSLRLAMEADPWHRSPVTYEVLRDVAYLNTLVAAYDEQDVSHLPGCVTLYERGASDRSTHGRQVTWHMPELVSASETLVRRKFMAVDAAFSVTATVTRTAGNVDWLMHPPAFAEARKDILDLAAVLGVNKAVANPWCLTWATVTYGGTTTTVEDAWIHAQQTETAGATYF